MAEVRIYRVTLAVTAAVPCDLPGHEVDEKEAKELIVMRMKQLFNNCEILDVKEEKHIIVED